MTCSRPKIDLRSSQGIQNSGSEVPIRISAHHRPNRCKDRLNERPGLLRKRASLKSCQPWLGRATPTLHQRPDSFSARSSPQSQGPAACTVVQEELQESTPRCAPSQRLPIPVTTTLCSRLQGKAAPLTGAQYVRCQSSSVIYSTSNEQIQGRGLLSTIKPDACKQRLEAINSM